MIAGKLVASEDVFIYLTAKYGEVDIFASENRELMVHPNLHCRKSLKLPLCRAML